MSNHLPVEVGQRVATALRYGQRDLDVRYKWGEVIATGKDGVHVHFDVAQRGKRDLWIPAGNLYAKAPDGSIRPARDVARLRAEKGGASPPANDPQPSVDPAPAPEESASAMADPQPRPDPDGPPSSDTDVPPPSPTRVEVVRRLAAEMSPDEVFAVMGVFAEMAAEGARRAVTDAEAVLAQAQRDRADAESILESLRAELATAQEVHEGTVRGDLAARARLATAREKLAAVTKHAG